MSENSVRLRGEGGVEWQFDLPLSEVYADQVRTRKLVPVDDDSYNRIVHLLTDDEEEGAVAEEPQSGAGGGESNEPSIDGMDGKALNALADELGVAGWKPKAKVADRRATLKAFIAAKEAETTESDAAEDPADLSDEDLAAKATELGLDIDPDADRDTVLAAVRAKLAE